MRAALPQSLSKYMNIETVSDLEDEYDDENLPLNDETDEVKYSEKQPESPLNGENAPIQKSIPVEDIICPLCGVLYSDLQELEVHTNNCLDFKEESEIPEKI